MTNFLLFWQNKDRYTIKRIRYKNKLTRDKHWQKTFDIDEKVIGTSVAGITVQDLANLEEFCKEHRPKAAFMCVPSSAAAELADRLIDLGVIGFWNFSHHDIRIQHPEVAVENVHFGDTLMRLSYKIKNS